MSKRAKKSTVETLQLVERPFLDDARVLEATELTDLWAHRVQASTDSLRDVQQTMQQLANALQSYERERRGAEIQAVYLGALNVQGLLEYRLNRENGGDALEPPPRGRGASVMNSSNRKSSSRPPSSSARRPGSGARGTTTIRDGPISDDAVATLLSAASAATSDPKRKQRCTSALQQYFKAPYVGLTAADVATEGADDATATTATAAAAAASDVSSPHSTKENPSARPPSASMGSCQVPPSMLGETMGSGGGGGGGARRPREVPSALWDEMSRLRQIYYTSNEKVTSLARALTEQLQRFALVRDNSEVACYAMEAVQVTLKSATADASAAALARQQAEAASASTESKTRGASAGSRKGKRA